MPSVNLQSPVETVRSWQERTKPSEEKSQASKTEQELLAEGVEAFEDSLERKKSAMKKGAKAFKMKLGGKRTTRANSVWSGVSYTTC